MRIITIFLLSAFSQLLIADEGYVNPVDGKTYVADWKTYQSSGESIPQEGRVINSGVRLLSTQKDFERNTTVEELSTLIIFIQEALAGQSKGYVGGGEIILQIEMSKENSPDIKMSYQGELTESFLQNFYSSLETIEYKTRNSNVVFQIHFVVKNA